MVVIRQRSPRNAGGATCLLLTGTVCEGGFCIPWTWKSSFHPSPDDPLAQLVKQDLDPLSVDELRERIETLEGEIARVKAKIEAAVNHRASAEDLFRK